MESKGLSRYEVLKLAIAATPSSIWESECYQDDSERIRYLFEVAKLIMIEERKTFGG